MITKRITTKLILLLSSFIAVSLISFKGHAKTYQTIYIDDSKTLTEIVKAGYKPTDSVIVIGKILDTDYQALKSMILRGSVCLNLKDGKFENNAIPDRAFMEDRINGPSPLESVTLPEDINKIGEAAFCFTQLKYINIPKSLTELGESAFCLNLYLENELIIPEQIKIIPPDCFASGVSLSNVKLNSKIERIESSAFEGCNLDSIVLPKNLKYLGARCFAEAINRKIYSLSLTPPVCEGTGEEAAFFGCFDCNLYVPKEALEKYKSTFPWSEFKQILPIEGSSGLEDISIEVLKSDQTTYDLMGRKVEKLVPGQIYIRGGKKFISK